MPGARGTVAPAKGLTDRAPTEQARSANDSQVVAVTCHTCRVVAMTLARLLEVAGSEPVFETGLLLAGEVNPLDVQRQLTRWTAAGKLWQLRRGLYALAPPYQKVVPHPFLVANRLVRASYVSLEAALAFHGLIPEYVALTTSVTTGRPGVRHTSLGDFLYRH